MSQINRDEHGSPANPVLIASGLVYTFIEFERTIVAATPENYFDPFREKYSAPRSAHTLGRTVPSKQKISQADARRLIRADSSELLDLLRESAGFAMGEPAARSRIPAKFLFR